VPGCAVTAIALCAAAFLVSFAATRRAIWAGFAATLAAGYFYGIVRANLEDPIAQFVYDAALAGFLAAACANHFSGAQRARLRLLMPWLVVLIGWPTLLLLAPLQPFLIQLVGWRGNVLFVPVLLVPAMLEETDLKWLARSLALLNLVALGFAVAEVFLGVARFYPDNPLDAIIYRSADVYFAGRSHLRIPAIFTHSAAYASTMVASMPLLLGALSVERRGWLRRMLLGAIGAAAVGVFLAASRSEAVVLLVIVVAVIFVRPGARFPWLGWLLVLLAVGWLVLTTPRLQRFFTLGVSGVLTSRVHDSVNLSFFDLLMKYPLGNGLGGGGTSIPYFLQPLLHDPIGLENEYARILAEQGLPGLALWLGFIAWLFTRPAPRRGDAWLTGWRLARLYCAISFLTAPLGSGMLNAIPQTALLMLFAGWVAAPPNAQPRRSRAASALRAVLADTR